MRRCLLCLLSLLALVTALPAAAQEGAQAGGTTVHVVQRDETLYGIAMQYGTTVEAISAANSIVDPRYLAVGQRLLIPNANLNAPGAVIRYTVAPGDSLATLARRFDAARDALVAANRLTNPALLYVGQELTISQGAADARPAARAAYHTAAGDNLPRLAVRFGVALRDLCAANALAPAAPLFAGELIWLPGDAGAAAVVDLPAHFTALALSPVPAVQGQTFSLRAATDGPARLEGAFMGYPVQIVTHDGNQHAAIYGVHPFAEAGVYPMTLSATFPDGSREDFTLRVRVDDGGYGTETITLAEAQMELLNPTLTEPEWERVAMLMSAFTAQRYFDGLMGLPSTGGITSEFGTRRVYNEGALQTFHSGTDLGGAPGSPVTAPAAGVVVLAEPLPVRGNAIIIDHGWGVITGYWHMAELKVAVGSVVAAGQEIGTVGTTGRSTGPHLHWEMWVGGVQVDPMQWVQQAFP